MSPHLCPLQHYDRRGQYEIALNKIDEAISHTPTVIDLYSVKVSLSLRASTHYVLLACSVVNLIVKGPSILPTFFLFQGKILEHAGNSAAASALADEARSMDLADRYLNSECVMQMLQADQVQLN
jgi:N-alpha-acetyltransferase 15/16, NatA auxiliary subunit